MADSISDPSEALIRTGFKRHVPDQPGLWEFACMENDHRPERVAVTGLYRALYFHAVDIPGRLLFQEDRLG
ncbi:MAG: hypothetical protein JWO82_2412 [Akkermansiaceae bacterium]|nr:hypothetical protein [Akkermansiaceae bacterium]